MANAFVSFAATDKHSLRRVLESVINETRTKWNELLSTRTLPWYAEEKAAQGSHAAFTGIRLLHGANAFPPKKRGFFHKPFYRWEAVGVGDVCMFIVRADELITAFPITRSADFDNSPRLISTLEGSAAHIATKSGEVRPGDTLFLMSDALAEWFLKSHENGLFPWKTIGKIKTEANFKLFIERLRAAKQIKNDDATALSITIGKLP